MGDDHEVQMGQIDLQSFDVVLKNVFVVAGVEQDALAVVLDQRRKSPITRKRRIISEGVVENSDAVASASRLHEKCEGKNAGNAEYGTEEFQWDLRIERNRN